eukprot:3937949-Rhodomonas_salina.1
MGGAGGVPTSGRAAAKCNKQQKNTIGCGLTVERSPDLRSGCGLGWGFGFGLGLVGCGVAG